MQILFHEMRFQRTVMYIIWVIVATVTLNSMDSILVEGTRLSRWLTPCHGSQPSDQEIYGINDDLESQLTVLQALWIKSHIVKEQTEHLRDIFANERIENAHLIDVLNNDTTLSDLVTSRNMSQHAQLPDLYVEHYRVIAVAAVYLTQLRDDEVTLLFEPSFLTYFTSLQTRMYALLCKLKISIEANRRTLPHVTRDVIYPSFRRMTSYAALHTRNYIVLKNIAELFNSLYQSYEQILNKNNTMFIITMCDSLVPNSVYRPVLSVMSYHNFFVPSPICIFPRSSLSEHQ